MRNVKKITLAALLLIAVGVIGAIITFSLGDDTTLAMERKVDMRNKKNIDIQADNARVTVHPAGTAQAEIKFEGLTSGGNEPELSAVTEGETLTIKIQEERRFIRLTNLMGSPSLHIYLPEERYESLAVEMDNGAFQAEDLSVTELQVKTDNGSITLDRISGDTANVSTSNGKINMNHVAGDITGKSNNGAISLDVADLDRHINLETDNGRITVQTENEPTNAVIDARTGNGKITVFGNSDWDTMIGAGENEIKLRTDNGRITIEK